MKINYEFWKKKKGILEQKLFLKLDEYEKNATQIGLLSGVFFLHKYYK